MVSPPLWHDRATRLLTIWRQPSFDPYASWTIFDAQEIWVRRVVAQPRYVATSPVDVDIYVSDSIFDARSAQRLIEDARTLVERLQPPRESGVVLDGMRLGIKTESIDVWWHSHLDTPYNACWDAARRQLDAVMPACTIPIQDRHQWIDRDAE
jgi:hypothetical protein